ncbi:putative integral membrane [Erysiphe neolycopersici]|uniref:Putative integral membrane n=1 Tax=Erysiphe neolycopersici TaxID=212602 RepID=A0A420I1C3_9PEZI|nr:putative integral membrane [Erysiphe neolycopersici]
MVNFMQRLSASAPQPTSFRDDKPSLLVSWWCTLYALIIINFRILGRYMRTKKIFLDDKVMILAIIPLIARMCCETTVVIHGTNNVDTRSLTEAQIRSREWGSKMVLISRILYILFLWTIKYSISIFLRTLTSSIWTRLHQAYLGYLHIFLFLTLVTAIVAVLAPCRPFNHFWQVVPDPGTKCRQNYVYVFTTGSLNILTNIVLVVFPIPMVLMSGLLLKQKLNILLRLSLPLFPIVLSLYAIPALCGQDPFATSQIRRTLLVSIDVLLTAFSANAVVLFSFLQDKGVKKSKFRHTQEGFHTNRFANTQRSDNPGSMEIANVELCDVGNLLQEGKLGNDIGGQNDSTTYQPTSKAGHKSTCLGKTNKRLSIDKRAIPNNQGNEMAQKKIKQLRLGMESNKCQRELVDETNEQIFEHSGQAKRYWKENSSKDSYLNSFSDGENEIIPPSPVYFGEIRLAHLQEIHLEDWSSREW